jgi:signal transduction histidine kinase
VALRLVRDRAGSAPRDEAEGGRPAVCLLINGRGAVVQAEGWESLSIDPVPASIEAGRAYDDPIVRAISEALLEARRTRRPSGRLAEITLERPYLFAVAAAPVPGPARSQPFAVTVVESGGPQASAGEGKVIRQLGHDLRTPLTSISGAVELLQSERLGGLQEGQRKVIGLLQKGAEGMLRLIDEACAPYRQGKDLAALLGVGVEELVAGELDDAAEGDPPGDGGRPKRGRR